MLVDKLDAYKERENIYVDDNIQEIQELFKEEEIKKEDGRIEEEIILIKPCEVLESKLSMPSTTSFITNEVENLLKFIRSPIQMRLFKPLPHYQSLKFRDEQDPEFWKEIAMALVYQKYNTETARNGYPIVMFQGGSPHKPYFIAINNQEQIIIGPSKKTVAIYVIGKSEVLI